MLYPLKFKPILKEVIWGGSDICPFKGISPVQKGIGESWEVSHVDGNYSVVANGSLEGTNLDELIKTYGSKLLGQKVMERFGDTFPLLIKFIDAQDDLSIQVHPDDELAKKRHNSFGKTEMWYVVKAADGAKLYSGFCEQINPDEYVKRVGNNTITDVLKRYDVKAGDVFFLPAGRVHAIGAGCFIAEIQQTSNITYRIYDYDRKGVDGKGRELHTELAKDAIDYTVFDDYRTNYTEKKDEVVSLADCKYFTTNLLELTKEMNRNLAALDSFVIYICMQGEVTLSDDKGNRLTVRQGETVLLPATTQNVTIVPSEDSKLLETYIG
jgi:mannose-6-phosphate isomerase